jgi:hypothetical protein
LNHPLPPNVFESLVENQLVNEKEV